MARVWLSVVIPFHNAERFIPACLDALAAQTMREGVEYIFVDNLSSDGSRRLLTQGLGRLPRARVVSETGRQSSYAARNRGVAAARGGHICFTDIDCRPQPRWVARGLAAALRGESRLVTGPVGLFPAGQRPNPMEIYDALVSLDQRRYFQRGYAATANLLVPWQAFERVGPFREVTSGGDKEFCLRAGAGGFGLAWDQALAVRHPARATWAELQKKTLRQARGGVENHAAYHPGPRGRARFILRQLLGLVVPRFQLKTWARLWRLSRAYGLRDCLLAAGVAWLLGSLERGEAIRLALAGWGRRSAV